MSRNEHNSMTVSNPNSNVDLYRGLGTQNLGESLRHQRERARPTEVPYEPSKLPDGQLVRMKTPDEQAVLNFFLQALAKGEHVTSNHIVAVLNNPASPQTEQGIYMTGFHMRKALGKELNPLGWFIKDPRGKHQKGQKALFDLVKIEVLQSEKVTAGSTSEKVKSALQRQVEPTNGQRKNVGDKKPPAEENPKADHTPRISNFRTPEQKRQGKEQAFTHFTNSVLSAKAGKGISSMPSDPRIIIHELPNNEYLEATLPKDRDALAAVLINGFYDTIMRIRQKISEKRELSSKEEQIINHILEIRRKQPDFKVADIPAELKELFTPTSSPATGFPKAPARSQ